MSFWKSGSGKLITGALEDARVPEFSIIPNNTTAFAQIKSFDLIRATDYQGNPEQFYQITWKIAKDKFKGREVVQKIKAFADTPEKIDRALNMLKLIMNVCGFKLSHDNAPTEQDLSQMQGKVLGIKIKEWSAPKKDGSGFIEGNFVSEVYPASDFVAETGIKLSPKSIVDSAFSRQATLSATAQFKDDSPIPF